MPSRAAAVLMLAIVGACDRQPDRPVVADSDAALDSVRAAERRAVDAWNRGDLDAHVAIFADTGTGGPPMGPGGRARARASLAPLLAQGMRLELDSLRVVRLAPTYVLASGRWRLRGESAARTGWFTHVWTRLPEGWRVTYEHSQ